MAFNMQAAISGAGSGAALGPYGAIAGGLIGGFMGGGEPELYSQADYERDMAPYMEMLNKQKEMSANMMSRGSAINRAQEQDIMQNSMDQMALANTMAGRQNAQQGAGIGNSGLLAAATQQNMSNYASQGLDASNKQFMQMYGQGLKLNQNVTNAMGDYYGGLANLNAANIGTMNAYNQSQNDMMMEGMGGLMGSIAGAKGTINNITAGVDAQGNPTTISTPQDVTGWRAWLSS
tara:strand:+ start:6853 stop:7554 length:702 start_codon:yes stop_codon:yes gene_type:complete